MTLTIKTDDEGGVTVVKADDECSFSAELLRGLATPTKHAGWDGEFLTVKADNGVFCYRVYVPPADRDGFPFQPNLRAIHTGYAGHKVDRGGLQWERAVAGRCMRCGNHPQICGHGLPFKERKNSIGINRLWAGTK